MQNDLGDYGFGRFVHTHKRNFRGEKEVQMVLPFRFHVRAQKRISRE